MNFVRRIGADLYSFFTSVRLAIVLISLVVVISLVGMFVPQRDWTREVDYLSRYGVNTYQWLKILEFDHVFSSRYFLFVIMLLVINLLACTHKRLAASIRYYRLKQKPIPPEAMNKMEIHRVIPIATVNSEAVQKKIMAILKKNFYRPREENGQVLAEKWRWERFGIDIFHISLLVLLGAGLMTATMTFRTFIFGHKGNEIKLDQGLIVRIDDFYSENYKSSERVMDWHTQLTILSVPSFEPVASKIIEVNDPLAYQGYKFFQAAFGQDWMGAAEVTLRVTRASDAANLGEIVAKVGDGFVEVAGGEIFVKVDAFLPDLDRTENGIFFSRTQRLDNPAAFITIVDGQGSSLYPPNCCWVHTNAAWKASWAQLSISLGLPYRIELVGMKAPEFTGIEVKKDPGQPIAYLGFVILVLGISTHLFFKHKMIWIAIGTDKILVSGMARNNPRQFENEFEQLVNEIEKIDIEQRVFELVNA